jgi:hypothetical protein
MGRRRTKTFRHPIYDMYLLMAADADQTGMTAAKAISTLKGLVPSMAGDVDTIVNFLGEASFIPSRVMDTTFEVLNTEEHSALQHQFARASEGQAELEREDVGPGGNVGFSSQPRRELSAARNEAGRITAEA